MTAMASIVISSSEVILQNYRQAGLQFSSAAKPTLLQAKVLNVKPPDYAELWVQGQKVRAKTYVPLKQGQQIKLALTKPGRQPIFRLVSTDGSHQLSVQNHNAGLIDGAQIFDKLSAVLSYLNKLPGHNEASASAKQFIDRCLAVSWQSESANIDHLKSIVKSSGLMWESKLARLLTASQRMSPNQVERLIANDLKALALRSGHPTGSADSALGRGLLAFGEAVENLQVLNKLAADEFGRYLLPLPLLENTTISLGQLFVDLGSYAQARANTDAGLIRLAFLLEMSNLGKIRGDFTVRRQTVQGTFGVAHKDTQAYMESKSDDLITKLNELGFDAGDIHFYVLSSETDVRQSLIDQMTIPTDKIISIVI